jgi:hypothetical protein
MSHESKAPQDDRLAKIKYAEEQVDKLWAFRYESLALLTAEAQTTLNWLFGLLISSSGYCLTQVEIQRWWLAAPLAIGTLYSAHEVRLLLRGALQVKKVPPRGNEPENIATEAVLQMDEAMMRHEHIKAAQAGLDALRELNIAKAAAINHARDSIVRIPVLTLALTGVLFLISWALGDHPSVYHP